MGSLPDDRSPKAHGCAAARMAARAIVAPSAILFVGAAIGFVAFLVAIARRGGKALAQRRRHRGADRRLLAGVGRDGIAGRPATASGCLISGVHPTNAASDISRSLPDNQSLLRCCVDLDRSAVNTRSNAAETRRWVRERGFKSLIVVTSNYHMPRAIVELSHAMPDIDADPVRGGRRQMARRAVVDERRDLPPVAVGIRQICRSRVAGAARRYRHRSDARNRRSRPARGRRTGRQRRRSTSVKSIHHRISPAVTILSRILALLVP